MTATTAAQEKGLWGMSRPLLVEQGLQLSVPLLDTFFLSRISDSSASAAGAVGPVIYFCANILLVTVFSGASIASQRLGAGDKNRTVATIATYSFWIFLLGGLLTAILYFIGPFVTQAMGLPEEVQTKANTYLSIICWLMLVYSGKMVFQSILNIFGMPQWNMYANVIYFIANIVGNAIVVFGLFGFPKMGIVGVAWASVIGSLMGVFVSGFAIFLRINLTVTWKNFRKEFRNASKHIGIIAGPSMIEPLSFDVNMIVLNGFAASLGATALAAKIYTFNTFMLGLIVTVALTMATEVLICQKIGAGQYQKAISQLKQSLKAALWGSGIVVFILLLLNQPIMAMYTDDQAILASSFWLFCLAALSEPPRALNVMVGGVLRATGDGFLISIIGPAFTWIVALPAAYFMAFVLDWGLYGIMASAILDEGCRSYMYWRRWLMNRWQHTHVHAREQKA